MNMILKGALSFPSTGRILVIMGILPLRITSHPMLGDRLMVKRILRKYKYPPDHQQQAVELVLQQAEALGETWA